MPDTGKVPFAHLAELAGELLMESRAPGTSDADAARWRAEAQTMALIAIAYELGELRGNLVNVKDALEDQDGFGVGTHARTAGDWLEKISDRLANM
jgi:hypothetical protein